MPQNQEVRLPAVVRDRLLVIADYQRPYAWELKQLNDLWEDLDLLGPNRTHYAGTLVLRPLRLDGDPNGPIKESLSDDGTTLQHCEVVDGQQRLTTCLILLDRVRRRLQAMVDDGVEAAAAIAHRLRESYGMVSIDNAQQPRLQLGSGLNSYWTEVILGDSHYAGPKMIAGQERLKEAVQFFDGKLQAVTAGASSEVQFARLRDLQRRVTAGLGFLVYEVQSIAEVGVIFETLNERGRPLTDLEKTKNYLLYLARSIEDARSEQLAQEINVGWSAIFASLAGEVKGMDDQLLRAHWLATQNPEPRNWKRIDSIKARFDRSKYISGETRLVPPDHIGADQEEAWNQLFHDVRAYVRSLRDCAFFFAEMFDPHADFESFPSVDRERVRRRSAALRRSGVVALYRPLLFAARLRYPVDGAFYADLVDLCERYSARVFVIEQRRANAGEPRLLRLAHDLYNDADPQQILDEVRSVSWRYAPDDRVRATLEATHENWYVRRGHKYFLYEYERSLMAHEQELPPLSYFTEAAKEQRTTEHILPQRPAPEATCWWDVFTADEHAELVHALGNIVLTYDNSVYSNKCFADKKGHPLGAEQEAATCYAQANLRQEQELAQYGEWTAQTIRFRQNRLADWALEHWGIASPDADTLAKEGVDMEAEGTEEDALLVV